GRLVGVLKLLKAGDVGALIWRSKQGVVGRVSGDHLPGHDVDNRLLRAGESRLVNADVAEQVVPACADVGDFKQQVRRERRLKAGVVLMEVRRAQAALERAAAQGTGDKRRE